MVEEGERFTENYIWHIMVGTLTELEMKRVAFGWYGKNLNFDGMR